jgi:MFS family permease
MLAALAVAVVPMIGLAALYVVLPVVAPALMADAGMRPEDYGWVGGASGLGSIWFYMANHAVTPVVGPVRTLQAGTLIALAGGLLVLSGSFAAILLGAAAIGFGYSTSTPAGSQVLAEHTPRRRWGTLFSLRQAGVPLGGVTTGLLGGALLAHHGWQSALLAIATLTAASGLALLLAPRRFSAGYPRARFRAAALFEPTNALRPFQAMALAPGLWRLAIACLGFALVQSVTLQFLVTYLVADLGYGAALAGLLFAVTQGASVIGRVALGFVADRIGSPRPVLVVLAAFSALSVLLLAALGRGWSLPALVSVATIVGLSVATWNGLYLAEVANLAPADRVSEATAGTTFFVFLTYTVVPPLFGLAARIFGYGPSYAATALAAIAAGALLLERRRPGGVQKP